MRIDPNEIGSSEWVFQEIKYLSDLSNEKLNEFFLTVVESLEWVNEYMEDAIEYWKNTFCDDFKIQSPFGSQQLLMHEKDSNIISQTSFTQPSILFKNMEFSVISSPEKLKDDFMSISEDTDIDYDEDILKKSEDNVLSMIESSSEQNINLKYDSSSTRVMEIITEEDEVEVEDEVFDIIEKKELLKNNIIETKELQNNYKPEINYPCVLKDNNIISSEDKSSESNFLYNFYISDNTSMEVNTKEFVDLGKNSSTAVVSEYKHAISPMQDFDLSRYQESRKTSNFDPYCSSTSIIHSHFSPTTNTSNATSCASPVSLSSLNFVSLPPREPLNTKKSLGKRTSQHGSFCETIKTQKILDLKPFSILKQEKQRDSFALEHKSLDVLQKQNIVSEEISEKKSNFNEIDGLDLSEKRLKTIFTDNGQKVHEVLNSLFTAKSTSGHFKPILVDQKQIDVEVKSSGLKNDLKTPNKISNILNNTVTKSNSDEKNLELKNAKYSVPKIDIMNKLSVSSNVEQEKQISYCDTYDAKNEIDNDASMNLDKSNETSKHRTSIITIPGISVMGAIQAAGNSAVQVIRKATSAFFSPSRKLSLRNSMENGLEQPLMVLNDTYDEEACIEAKRDHVFKENLKKDSEIFKNMIYNIETEQPNNIIDIKQNCTKASNCRKEMNINETQFPSKESPLALIEPTCQEINTKTNRFSSQELSSQNFKKTQASQQVKLNNLNSISMTKNKPISIRITTASQRQADFSEKNKVQKADFRVSSQQSFTVHSQNKDFSAIDPVQYTTNSQESSISTQSQPLKRVIFSKGIKALTAATIARRREQEEKDKKLAHKKEIERKRQENLKKQEENKKQEQLYREDIQRKTQHEKINGIKKKKPILDVNEHSSFVIKKACTKSSENNARGPLEDIINNDRNRDTLNMEVNPFKRVFQDELVQENWSSFSTSNKSLMFQEVKKRKTDDNSQDIVTNVPIQASNVKKDNKDSRFSKSQIKEKAAHFHFQIIPQKQAKPLQNRYPGNQPILPLKNTKITGPVVDSVKFSSDSIRFVGESSKTASTTYQFPPSESIELPEIDSDYSDDDELKKQFKLSLPQWAESPELTQILKMQAKIDPDEIFGPMKPLQMEEIFRGTERAHTRFRSRSSSANWSGQDRLTEQEIENYAKMMGYRA